MLRLTSQLLRYAIRVDVDGMQLCMPVSSYLARISCTAGPKAMPALWLLRIELGSCSRMTTLLPWRLRYSPWRRPAREPPTCNLVRLLEIERDTTYYDNQLWHV